MILLFLYNFEETQWFQKSPLILVYGSAVEFLCRIYEALNPITNAAEGERTKQNLTSLS